ncbi:clavesin-2-like [Ischnura elegans]|uniref:clavesin-2-like n=1 Tax=Ischnura elegans TaxID=197161 RepID=UPI001ED8A4E1|nr:clavesin-2-like [Ischnura elegans]
MVEFLEYQWNIKQITPDDIPRKEIPLSDDQALKSLQELIAADPSLCEENFSNEYLLCFLRVRAFNAEAAFRMISCRHLFKKKNPHIFVRSDISDTPNASQGGVCLHNVNKQEGWIRAALEEGLPGVLPEKDPRGCHTLLFFPGQWDPNASPLIEGVLLATLMSLEAIIEECGGKLSRCKVIGKNENCDTSLHSNGGNSASCNHPTEVKKFEGNSKRQLPKKCIIPPKVVAIVDWSGFTMSRCGTVMSSGIRSFIECLQTCVPVHCEGIHFVSQPWYVDGALKLLRPFLTEKTREKIHVHGNNLSQLHSIVGQRHLPAELGGDEPPFHTITWADKIMKIDKKAE